MAFRRNLSKGYRTCIKGQTQLTSMRIMLKASFEFLLEEGLDQGPYLFTLVMSNRMKDIKDEVLQCVLFVEDMVPISQT